MCVHCPEPYWKWGRQRKGRNSTPIKIGVALGSLQQFILSISYNSPGFTKEQEVEARRYDSMISNHVSLLPFTSYIKFYSATQVSK